MIAGRLNKQIASELETTERTIKFHRGHIMEKMEAASVAGLVRMAWMRVSRAWSSSRSDQPAAMQARTSSYLKPPVSRK